MYFNVCILCLFLKTKVDMFDVNLSVLFVLYGCKCTVCVVEKSNLTIMVPNLHVFLICVSCLVAYPNVHTISAGQGHPPIINLARSQPNFSVETCKFGR